MFIAVEDLVQLPPRLLKEAAQRHGLDIRGCVEKGDIAQILLENGTAAKDAIVRAASWRPLESSAPPTYMVCPLPAQWGDSAGASSGDLSLPPIPRGGSSGIVGRPPSSSSGGTPSWDGPVTRELLFPSAKSLNQAFKSAGLDIRNLPADMVIPSRWVLLPDGQGTQVRIAQAIEDREYVDGVDRGVGVGIASGMYDFGLPVFFESLAARGLTIEHWGGPEQRWFGTILLQWSDIIIFCPAKHAWPYCLRCDRFLYPPHDHRCSNKHRKGRKKICMMSQEAGAADTRSWMQFRIADPRSKFAGPCPFDVLD